MKRVIMLFITLLSLSLVYGDNVWEDLSDIDENLKAKKFSQKPNSGKSPVGEGVSNIPNGNTYILPPRNEPTYMSPPDIVYKPLCVSGYIYIMFIVRYGWLPDRNQAEKIDTQMRQLFDKYGKGVPCK